MSGSHKEFPKKAVGIQLGLAALVGIGFLFADKSAVHATAEKVTKPIVVAAQKALAPIGKVEVKEEKVASAARTGEEVYASGCGTCHDNGVAGAPKIEDKATWETRLTGGFTALVTSAINGKGGMPARGGNPDNTDSEMELAVSHMIKKGGIELVAKSAAGNAAAPATEAKPVATSKTEEAPKAKEVKKEAESTKVEEVIKVEETAKVEETTEVETKTVEKVSEKVEEVVKEAKETVAEKVDEVKTEVATAVASATAATAAVVDHSKGEEIYKASCFACHESGVAGSPKVGDKDAWSARIAAGVESMYTAAIKGKGAMPAKGGNMSISDDDIKAAVDFMAAKSQ